MMKFLVDQYLGGLAKWLRFCGFDAASRRLSATAPGSLPPPAPDVYILTRQESLARLGRPDLLILQEPTPEAQLEEVIRGLKISRGELKPLSRCSRCNEPLAPVDREGVKGLVPEHVFNCQEQFYQCPRCLRIFWPGSHLKGIYEKALAKLA